MIGIEQVFYTYHISIILHHMFYIGYQLFCNMYHFTSLALSIRRFRRSIETVKYAKTRINTGV